MKKHIDKSKNKGNLGSISSIFKSNLSSIIGIVSSAFIFFNPSGDKELGVVGTISFIMEIFNRSLRNKYIQGLSFLSSNVALVTNSLGGVLGTDFNVSTKVAAAGVALLSTKNICDILPEPLTDNQKRENTNKICLNSLK